jgi:hypothetical protein
MRLCERSAYLMQPYATASYTRDRSSSFSWMHKQCSKLPIIHMGLRTDSSIEKHHVLHLNGFLAALLALGCLALERIFGVQNALGN